MTATLPRTFLLLDPTITFKGYIPSMLRLAIRVQALIQFYSNVTVCLQAIPTAFRRPREPMHKSHYG